MVMPLTINGLTKAGQVVYCCFLIYIHVSGVIIGGSSLLSHWCHCHGHITVIWIMSTSPLLEGVLI
jgi:hypothetical protein